jgi:DNA-binding FadR family transcriptional regulator
MSRIVLKPQPKNRLADVLYGQLLEQIMAGALMPGDRLPTENQICDAFQVSRPVVREALMRLRADGLVEPRRGSGTYLRQAPSPEIKRFLDPGDFASSLRSLEVRMAMEPVAARYAAMRHSHADLARIKAAADAFADAVTAGEAAQTLDIAFHRAIAVATGNELFARQFDGLSTEIESFIGVSLGLTWLGSSERKKTVLQEHGQIVEAIGIGDGDLAATYMTFHLSQARRRLTDVTRQP